MDYYVNLLNLPPYEFEGGGGGGTGCDIIMKGSARRDSVRGRVSFAEK